MPSKLVNQGPSTSAPPAMTDALAAERIVKVLAKAVNSACLAKAQVTRIISRAPGTQAVIEGYINVDYRAEVQQILDKLAAIETAHGPTT